MDNQPVMPVMPTGPNPFNASAPRGGTGPLIILIALLGLGAAIFAVLTFVFFGQARTATSTLNSQKALAAAAAKADQQKADELASTITAESPYRSYTAPEAYGAFEIKFPKTWSAYVDQEQVGTQISLALNPDFIRRTNNVDELMATRVQLIERTRDTYMQPFSSLIKTKKIIQSDTTVSGQKGYDLTGSFQDKKVVREVVIPVRDKVMVFINENATYAREFNEILAQAKIIP